MKKVLLVDDDQNIINLYKNCLQLGKFDVLVARNGEEGLSLALKEQPDLILLDIAMPKMDGMIMMKKLRENNWGSSVPIIMLTNLDTDNETLRGVVENHPVYYLLKNLVTPDGVLEKVKEVLRND